MSRNTIPRQFIVEQPPRPSHKQVKITFHAHDGHTRVLRCRYTALQVVSSLKIDFEAASHTEELL